MRLNATAIRPRTRAIASAVVLAISLSTAPALIAPAGAATSRASRTSAVDCQASTTAMQRADHQQATARAAVVAARKALRKARRHHNAAKIRRARRVLTRTSRQYAAAAASARYRQVEARYACASPTSTTAATGAGKKLDVLAVARGVSVGPIDVGQLTTLVNQLLPGVSQHLDPSQLAALLAGFNGGTPDPTELLGLLSGILSPTQIAGLLTGSASGDVLTGLAGNIIGQLSGLGGGLPVPDSFDPTQLWNLFSGMFGNLDPSQLGDLLGLLTTATGQGSSTFDLGQLTSLIQALVPTASSAFGPADLTTMLGALNGPSPDATSLAALLGGRFGPGDLTQVLAGTASPQLTGDVLANVLAQLETGGTGNLNIPTHLDTSAVTSLISTVTGLITSVLGGGPLGSLCGIIPLPLICP
ncbi:MAG: hypothetical protein JWQ32_1108 [Marmoricola sp.]|nr:hypothetical protein [Marmoricola sp.]